VFDPSCFVLFTRGLAAFCFYNLSSILNGLVYFDQFSVIAAFHLTLVFVGIIILLGGVWIVSIHSGGGGVDIGTTFDEVSQAEDEVWGTQSEAHIVESVDTEAPLSPISTVTCPLPAEAGTSLATRLPGHGRHATYDSNYSRRRRPSHSGPLSPPINAVASLAGAGFQIGLSPASPGFSILPRRRVSYLGLGLAGDIDEVSTVSNRRPGGLERRRTVSEGYAQIATALLDARSEEHEDAEPPARRPKRRWKWLRDTSHRL
jgi:magnesium transporter